MTAQFSRSFPPIASFLLLYGTLELEVHIRGDHCCDDILKNNKIWYKSSLQETRKVIVNKLTDVGVLDLIVRV